MKKDEVCSNAFDFVNLRTWENGNILDNTIELFFEEVSKSRILATRLASWFFGLEEVEFFESMLPVNLVLNKTLSRFKCISDGAQHVMFYKLECDDADDAGRNEVLRVVNSMKMSEQVEGGSLYIYTVDYEKMGELYTVIPLLQEFEGLEVYWVNICPAFLIYPGIKGLNDRTCTLFRFMYDIFFPDRDSIEICKEDHEVLQKSYRKILHSFNWMIELVRDSGKFRGLNYLDKVISVRSN